MKQICSRSSLRLVVIAALFLSSFFIQQSCRKLDISEHNGSPSTMTDGEIYQRFFNVPANAPDAVKHMADQMKAQNAANEYISKFAKDNGFPVWDKAIVSTAKKLPTGSQQRNGEGNSVDGEEEGATTITLPIVPWGEEFVTGFVEGKITDTVLLALYRGGDYSMYSFDDVPDSVINADKAAMQIMQLNKKVFGYTKFKVDDNRLFSNETQYNPNAKRRAIQLIDSLYNQTSNVSIASGCHVYEYYNIYYDCDKWGQNCEIDHGEYGYVIQCPGGGNPNTTPPPSNTPSGTGGTGTGTGGTGTGTGSTGGGSGGGPTGNGPAGGGGGGGTVPLPCPSSQSGTIPPPNCTPVPDPPIHPYEELDTRNPCDSVVLALNNNSTFIGKFQALNADSVFTSGREWGFLAKDLQTNSYFHKKGLPGVGQITYDNLTGTTIDGKVHTHFTGYNSIFSMEDLISIAYAYHDGLMSDPAKYFEGMTSQSGGPYLLRINNLGKFKAWADTIVANEEKRNKLLEKNKDIAYINNPQKNETEFLKILDSKALYGVFTLFGAEENCTDWRMHSLFPDGASALGYRIDKTSCNN